LLGVEKDTENRFSGARSWEFDVHNQGWRAHMSNVMASIGTVQLDRFDDLSFRRQTLAAQYKSRLHNLSRITLLESDFLSEVPHIFPILLKDGNIRELVRKYLLSCGVESGIHYKPNHHLNFYSKPLYSPELTVTEDIYDRLLTLPLHPDLSEADVDFVVASLEASLDKV
jgi:dTDP-4-amino-4,6-dideoxygalactose transaminase